MTQSELEAIVRDAASTMMRAEQRIHELQVEVDRLEDENTKLRKKLQKTRQTIRRMEEGEL